MQVKCKDCPKTFKLSDGEIEFFKQKELALPRRCPPCRKLKRDRNNPDKNKPFAGKLDGFEQR